jgi:hypothetical protein
VSTRSEIAAAVLIALATYGVLLRLAEAKVERAVGTHGFPLDAHRAAELEAFERERKGLDEIGQRAFAGRLEELRAKGALWVAPELGAERWAVFVESLRLVRGIYVRRAALLDPRAHLYPGGSDIPDPNQRAFAFISLSGALRHELAHYDGHLEENAAYASEIAWYEELRGSPWFAALVPERQRVYAWALDSAVLTARRAAGTARETEAR